MIVYFDLVNNSIIQKETVPEVNLGEVWKTIPSNRFHYEVSSKGRVRRNGKLKKISIRSKNCGYLRTTINDKSVNIHKLVLPTFRPNTQPWFYDRIDHIDGDPTNNHIENLRWSNSTLNNLNRRDRKEPVFREGRSKPYQAMIQLGGKSLHLGYFKTAMEAKSRVLEAVKDAFEVLDYQMF